MYFKFVVRLWFSGWKNDNVSFWGNLRPPSRKFPSWAFLFSSGDDTAYYFMDFYTIKLDKMKDTNERRVKI